MIERVDKNRQSKDIGKKDKLLTGLGTDLSGGSEELECRHPLTCRQCGLSRKIMEMFRQFVDQELQTLVLALRIDDLGVLGDTRHTYQHRRKEISGSRQLAWGITCAWSSRAA